jgi:hypothetical protein
MTLGAATAAMVMVAGPAVAGSNSNLSTTAGASARFLHVGDLIKVCDTESDGESVYAEYQINGGSTRTTSQHNGGNNTCGEKSTGNPSEGSEVRQRASRQAEFAPDNHGEWKTGIA